jgi:hypothetical protein
MQVLGQGPWPGTRHLGGGSETTLRNRQPNALHVLRSGIIYRQGMLAWLSSLPWTNRSSPEE